MTSPSKPILPLCICRDRKCKIPYGYCHCGCGLQTALARQSVAAKNQRRGLPMQYAMYHSGRNAVRLPVRIGKRGVHVPLSKGYWTLVDIDVYKTMPPCWFAQICSGIPYAAKRIDGKLVLLHRWILGIVDGHVMGDHRSGITLDNRKSNLRTCSKAENQRNGKARHASSGFKGVWRHRDKWHAGIRVNYDSHSIGTFDDPIDAALAYDRAARKYHGSFARLNFPRKGEQQA